MSILSIKDLDITLESSSGPIDIVKGLNFEIPKGSIFGLAGESGCGKSLTALAIMGILPRGMKATGNVEFSGKELLTMDRAKLRSLRGSKLSMIFQEPMTSLNPVLKIGYQIEEVLNTHLAISKKEAQGIAVGLLRDLGIPSPDQRMREYPHQMSGGMRQRIMVAMAIACGPELLIADEPTTALDVTIEAQLLRIIRSLRDKKDMSVLFITHDLGIIAENAETVGIMYAGRLVEMAPVASLFAQPLHPYTQGLLGSLPETKGTLLIPIQGTVPRPWELPKGCKFSDRCQYVINACKEKEPELITVEGAETSHLSRCLLADKAPWRQKAQV